MCRSHRRRVDGLGRVDSPGHLRPLRFHGRARVRTSDRAALGIERIGKVRFAHDRLIAPSTSFDVVGPCGSHFCGIESQRLMSGVCGRPHVPRQ